MSNKKKVGILTYSHTHNLNYGAMLQSFAIYEYVKKLNCEPYIINWSIKKKNRLVFQDISRESKIVFLLKSIRRVFTFFLIPLIKYARVKIGDKPFKSFTNTYMPSKTSKVKMNKLKYLNEGFDYFIVGSDQVWRYKTCPDIETFFLNFVNEERTKISYAASFGIDNWNEAPKKVKEKVEVLINKFDFVSVREKSGIKICKEDFNVNAEHVLDPTLLFSENDYIRKFKLERFPVVPKSNYVAVMLLDAKDKSKFIQLIKEKNQSEAVNIKGKAKKILGFNFTKFYQIKEWLSLIKFSDIVITDSYHCTIFSILFKKKFFVIAHKGRGVSRLESLLSLLGLGNRLFATESDLLNSNLWNEEIDYTVSEKILSSEKQKSTDYLKNALA